MSLVTCVIIHPSFPGWKSQPGNGAGGGGGEQRIEDPKCLLSYLKSQSEGGGSKQDFVVPTHRLDQPCTGVLVFAKNGKAASRIQVAWSKKQVKKEYWVVVETGDDLDLLKRRSVPLSRENNGKRSFRLSAILKVNKSSQKGGGGRRGAKNAGGSVVVTPLSSEHDSREPDGRVCHIEWQQLLRLQSTPSGSRHLLSVKTDTGAKHQVRALLGLHGGAPISGDLRYGNQNNSQFHRRHQAGVGRVDKPLPDGSVALHARSVFLPTVKLGGMEFLAEESFVAPIPKRWAKFFDLREGDVKNNNNNNNKNFR